MQTSPQRSACCADSWCTAKYLFALEVAYNRRCLLTCHNLQLPQKIVRRHRPNMAYCTASKFAIQICTSCVNNKRCSKLLKGRRWCLSMGQDGLLAGSKFSPRTIHYRKVNQSFVHIGPAEFPEDILLADWPSMPFSDYDMSSPRIWSPQGYIHRQLHL